MIIPLHLTDEETSRLVKRMNNSETIKEYKSKIESWVKEKINMEWRR